MKLNNEELVVLKLKTVLSPLKSVEVYLRLELNRLLLDGWYFLDSSMQERANRTCKYNVKIG